MCAGMIRVKWEVYLHSCGREVGLDVVWSGAHGYVDRACWTDGREEGVRCRSLVGCGRLNRFRGACCDRVPVIGSGHI
jgi:hypothetical protein